LATQRLSDPLSAPLVQEMPPFSYPVNLPALLKLVQVAQVEFRAGMLDDELIKAFSIPKGPM
jgi:hypothetical protein